jgi:hypothetical protein
MLALGSPDTRAATGLVTTINWYNIEAYCSFMRMGNVFVYDDPSTWNLVFFNQFAEDGSVSGYVSIEGRLLQLEWLSEVENQEEEVWTYRSLDAAATYDVVLSVEVTGRGTENTDYRGDLKVMGPAGTETLTVEGGCGA